MLDDATSTRGDSGEEIVESQGGSSSCINPGTFSAASNLVTLLERWTPAIFVGEPTGDPPNGYGDPKRTVLPNSGLTVQVSTLYWQVSNPKDKRDAIAPLIPAAPTIASVGAHRDVALEVVKSLDSTSPTSTDGTFAGQCDISGQMIKVSFDITKDRLLLNVPALKIANQTLQDLERHDGTVSGKSDAGRPDSFPPWADGWTPPCWLDRLCRATVCLCRRADVAQLRNKVGARRLRQTG